MKKYCIYLLGLLAVLATSCTVEQPAEVILSGDGYTAVIEAPAATRTVADENLHVLWSKGDQLSIFDQSTWNGQYELKGEGGTNTGEFKKIERTDYHAGVELPFVYAVYPYNEANNVTNEGVISVTLPAAQTYAPNSFGPGAATMASIAVGKELKFKNLCGFFSVKLYGNAKVKSITIKGANNEPIAGAATITAPEEGVIPVLAMAATATKEITLTCTEPVQLGTTEETATTFWIAVPPTEFTKGVTVTVTNDKGETFEKTSNAVTIVRNTKTDTRALKAFEDAGTPMFLRHTHWIGRAGKELQQNVWYGTVDNFAAKKDVETAHWVSADPAIATVDEYGFVKGVAPGQTTVTVDDGAGNSLSFPVTILPAASDRSYDYNYGIQLIDCSNGDLYWNKKNNIYTLKDGYVKDTKRVGATINGYKVAELWFTGKPKESGMPTAPAVDASGIQNPALFIRFYINDASKLLMTDNDDTQIELRSGMVKDQSYEDKNEINWTLKSIFTNANGALPSAKYTLKNGWNNLVLPFDAATNVGETSPGASVHQGWDPSNINYFRFYQQPGLTYQEFNIIFDQIRIVDYTELDKCDNFDMWFDRCHWVNYGNALDYVREEGLLAVDKHMMTDPCSNFRLEMWPGREFAVPANKHINDMKLSFKFWTDNAEFFNDWVSFRVEICSQFTPEHNGWFPGFDPRATNTKSNFVNGWNNLTFNFSDIKTEGEADERLIKYIRFIFTPVAVNGANPPVKVVSYKIDDFRIEPK